jgi:hypothetical protein
MSGKKLVFTQKNGIAEKNPQMEYFIDKTNKWEKTTLAFSNFCLLTIPLA